MKKVNRNFSQPLSWKACKMIRKKATEQSFSWSGIMVSLSLSLVIVVICAQTLNVFNKTLELKKNSTVTNQVALIR